MTTVGVQGTGEDLSRLVERAMARHEAEFRFDPEVGAALAREKLAAVAGRTRFCSALVRLCCAVIPADGVIHPTEHRALAEIRSALGVAAGPSCSAPTGTRPPPRRRLAPTRRGDAG